MEKIRKKSSGKRAGSVSLRLILCLACLLLLGGCRKKEEVHPTAGEDGVYQIYYLNSTRTGLASVSYQTETTDAEILIGELAGQILAAQAHAAPPSGSPGAGMSPSPEKSLSGVCAGSIPA